MIKLALIGNPNVGKTSVFNYITGSQYKVGNFPGITVEKKEGFFNVNDTPFSIIDLPGMYSLVARSPDEVVARKYILNPSKEEEVDLYINIIDSNNLNRNLYLTTHLLQFNKPVIILLTMNDVAKTNGVDIDSHRLSLNLGVPVIKIDPRQKKGKELFLETILEHSKKEVSHIPIFPKEINEKVAPLSALINDLKSTSDLGIAPFLQGSFFTYKLLEKDEEFETEFPISGDIGQKRGEVLEDFKTLFVNEMPLVLAQFRYNFVDTMLKEVFLSQRQKVTVTQKIDRFLLHRILGLPLFFLILWACFKVSIGIGEAFQDFFDILFGSFFVDYLGNTLSNYPLLKLIFADGIGSGIQAMTTFIPVVFMLYLCMYLLEDTGYMARVTVLMDRLMRRLGLPGKSLAPLLMGFGCNVTSIMGSRILETPEERKISIAMSPFISCGARLPVYTVITMALFPDSKGFIVFSLYCLGLIAAIITAFFLHKFVFSSKTYSFLLLEMPEYHRPQFRTVMASSYRGVKGLVKRGIKLMIYFTVFFQILNQITFSHISEGKIIASKEDKSILRSVSEAMTVPLQFMGIHKENWPAAVGLLNGLIAKEGVVSSLAVSYSTLDAIDQEEEKEVKTHKEALGDLWESAKDAVMSVPHNIIGSWNDKKEWEAGLLTDPNFYIPFYTLFNPPYEAKLDMDEAVGLIPSIHKHFENPIIENKAKRQLDAQFAAYAFLLFILLYTGCVAVISAIKKELGSKWAWGLVSYQLIVAYLAAVIFYQIAHALFIS